MLMIYKITDTGAWRHIVKRFLEQVFNFDLRGTKCGVFVARQRGKLCRKIKFHGNLIVRPLR